MTELQTPPRSYSDFLSSKTLAPRPTGREVDGSEIHPSLFGFQSDMSRWALRKGKAALFTTTGTGKTRMQIEFARLCGERALIIAPLAVAQQTIREAANIGVEIVYARRESDCGPGITITNYEMVEKVNPRQFGAVVCDESGILKDYTSATRNMLIETFCDTPWRLCCTATPAPNDIAEIANHAEFLGIMTRTEMLSSFFVHDDAGWRLKGHARRPFFRWMASWAMSLNKPSDLGYPDDGYNLPPLHIESVVVDCDATPKDRLFFGGLKGIGDRSATRRATASDRVKVAADLINSGNGEPWVAWCGLNEESDSLSRSIPDCVHVYGTQHPEIKANLLLRFAENKARVLVTKPKIGAHGLNLQHCSKMVFVGLGDSFEQYFQAIRRCWRFGQTREVTAYIVLSEVEQEIHANVLRKEREHETMSRELINEVSEFEKAEMRGIRGKDEYHPSQEMRMPEWM
jgi:hypothetical protein